MSESDSAVSPRKLFDATAFQMSMDALEHFFVKNRIHGCRVGFTVKEAGVYVTVSLPQSHFTTDVYQIVAYTKENNIPVIFLKEMEFTPEEALKL